MKVAHVALLAYLLATQSQAQELVVGLGYTEFNDNAADSGGVLEVEYHFAPRWKLGGGDLYLAMAAMTNDPGDYFIGAGVGAEFPLGDKGWFLQGSIMPGYYDASSAGNDLGSDFEFRSSLALGYRMQSGWALSAAASHFSNAGLGDSNPGLLVATLRLGRSF
ncbi:MAG TPA: acyloxyacyl hydrolase [Albidovulum sp.]|uniref:acyloxyacyl hydrolase n=1 Tax=Albidovulum sp. TaxID=1872424 RepID=UPI002BF8FED9|nr:acyloxyacyl hydrolase [Albidovulum sp.]